MKSMYIECNMGAAGDMLMAALLELHPDPEEFMQRMNTLGIPNVRVSAVPSIKCGVTGTGITVKIGEEEERSCDVSPHWTHSHEEHHSHEHVHSHGHSHEHLHEHGHTNMAEITDILDSLHLSKKIRFDVMTVYNIIAEAESEIHGISVEDVFLHEVGMMDAVTDIVGVAMLMDEISPQEVVVSPVHVGSGQVRCAHGILPVPAPATAYILRGVPMYGGQIQGELCTPTGAALLKYFATRFGNCPTMVTDKIGYGMGKKDFLSANCVRIFLGETEGHDEDIIEIACNLDDMTGEELGYALGKLMENDALDAYIVDIHMKKNRPGHMLVCLCRSKDEDKMTRLMLEHTTTLGVRSAVWKRNTMERSIEAMDTKYGNVNVKIGVGHGITKSKIEFDDLVELAEKNKMGIPELKNQLMKIR